MTKSLIMPSKYFQGSGLLSDAYRYVSHIGRRFTVIADAQVKDLIEERIKEGFRNAGNECTFLIFRGETSIQEVRRLVELTEKEACSGIIGAGGGKAIDAAKLVGDICGLPVVTVPTSASNDAACSCVASIYREEGIFFKLQKLKEAPAVVLADTGVIAKAPVRLLSAGMGTALSTYYEARACQRSGVLNYTEGIGNHTVFSLLKLCRSLLLQYGEQAKKDVQLKSVTGAVEAVVEANIYLSSIGFVNSGCAASHAIYSALTSVVPEFKAMDGEGRAFGTLVQLIMEYEEAGSWDSLEWDQTIHFYRKVDLPRNFLHLGENDVKDSLLIETAEAACQADFNIYNMPFEVTERKVYNAMRRLRDMDLT